ncbi:MAG: Hsp20/alpha crystallin family protein [Nocardioides sp.]
MSSTLSRRARDPFGQSFLSGEFDQLVRAAFGPSVTTGPSRSTAFSPAAEAHRDGEDAVIRVELPGVSTDDVSVEVKGRHLVISGSRHDEREEQSEGRRFSEFRYGDFSRAFRLAPSVTADAVSASYDAGVLTVRVSGAYAETEGHKIAISTGSSPELSEGESQEG